MNVKRDCWSNNSDREKPYPSANLYYRNLIHKIFGLKPGFRGDRIVTNRLRQDTAYILVISFQILTTT